MIGCVVRLLGEVPTIIPPLAQKKEHCFRHPILVFRGQFPHVCDNFLKLLRHMESVPRRYAVTRRLRAMRLPLLFAVHTYRLQRGNEMKCAHVLGKTE